MLDTEELEFCLDLSSTNSDFEETQELKYSMDLSTNSSENIVSELSSNNDNRSTDLSSDTDLGRGSELRYDDDDDLTNLNEHLKPYNYEFSCQHRKHFISKSENDEDSDVSSDSNQEHNRKGNLIGVLVDIAGQWRQRLRVYVVEIQTKLLIITSKVTNL